MPRKEFNRSVAFNQSAVLRQLFVGFDNAAGDKPVTSATVENTGDICTYEISGSPEGINTYTGATGTAGQLVITDAQIAKVKNIINVINGIEDGQPKPDDPANNRRWKAVPADVHPERASVTGLITNLAAANALLGHRSPGVRFDIGITDEMWVGIGYEGGVVAGSGLILPTYYEDRPGKSQTSGFSSNTPDRTRQKAKQNDDGIFVRKVTPVIDYLFGVTFASAGQIDIWSESQDPATDTPLYTEDLATGGKSAFLDGEGDNLVVGFPGEALFVRFSGTTMGFNSSVVAGYYEEGLTRR